MEVELYLAPQSCISGEHSKSPAVPHCVTMLRMSFFETPPDSLRFASEKVHIPVTHGGAKSRNSITSLEGIIVSQRPYSSLTLETFSS